MTTPGKTRRRSRWRTLIIVILALIASYGLVGFFVIPAIAPDQVKRIGDRLLGADLEIGKLYLNPFTFFLEISDLRLKGKDGDLIFSLNKARVDWQLSSFVRGKFAFKLVEVDGPVVHIIVYPGGNSNFDDTLNKLKDIKIELPPTWVKAIRLQNAHVTFTDTSLEPAFSTEINPINASINDFSSAEGQQNQFRATARVITGESVKVEGSFGINPLGSRGSILVDAIEITHGQAYLNAFTTATAEDGSVALKLDYELDTTGPDVDIRLSNGSVQLRSLRAMAPDVQEPVIRLGDLKIEGINASYAKRQINVDSVVSSQGALQVQLLPNGTINLLQLLKQQSDAGAKSDGPSLLDTWQLTISRLTLEDYAIRAEDRRLANPVVLVMDPLDIQIENISLQQGVPMQQSLTMRLNDEAELKVEGDISITPLAANLNYRLNAFDLTPLQIYVGDYINARLLSGILQTQGNVTFEVGEGEQIKATVQSDLEFNNLVVAEQGQTDALLATNTIAFKQVEAQLEPLGATIGELNVSGLDVHVIRTETGEFNLLRLLPSDAEPGAANTPQAAPDQRLSPTPSKAADAPPLPAVTIKKFILNDANIQVRDQAVQPEMQLSLASLNGSMSDLSMEPTAKAGFAFTGAIKQSIEGAKLTPENGAFRVEGDVAIESRTANVTYQLQGLDLRPFHPYVGAQMNADLLTGTLHTDGTVSVGMQDGQSPSISMQSNLTLSNLAVAEKGKTEPVASSQTIAFKTIKATLSPLGISIDELALDGLDVTVDRSADGDINVMRLLPKSDEQQTPAPQSTTASSATTAKQPLPDVTIKRVVMNNVAVNVNDDAVKPASAISLEQFSGTVKGLGTSPTDTATFEFEGVLNKKGAVAISGDARPLADAVTGKVALEVNALALKPLSGYSAQAIGYPIESGTFNLDTKADIKAGQLHADNAILLNKMVLGERIEGTEAPDLPLKTAMSLMKDTQGNIKIKLPIDGDLKNPKFNIGAVIASSMTKMITGIVASPFKLLASISGDKGGETMGVISFTPGSSNLSKANQTQLRNVVQGLQQRPELKLEISASPPDDEDRQRLTQTKLTQALMQGRGQKATTPTPKRDLSQDEYKALVRSAYQDRYRTKTSQPSESTEPSITEMENKLQADLNIDVSDDELQTLAKQRADVVQTYLVQEAKLDKARVTNRGIAAKAQPDTHVNLSLK